jgi:hypothetical protein
MATATILDSVKDAIPEEDIYGLALDKFQFHLLGANKIWMDFRPSR